MDSIFAGCGGAFREAIEYDRHPPNDVLERYINGELRAHVSNSAPPTSDPDNPADSDYWDEHTVAVHVMTCTSCEQYVTERKYQELNS